MSRQPYEDHLAPRPTTAIIAPRMANLSWGIIGAGSIAKSFFEGMPPPAPSQLAAVASRSKAKADQFIADNAITGAKSHGSYESLLADPAVQAVYISTP